MPAPELTRGDVGGRPNGLVLMLHGGRADSLEPVGDKSTSWRRSAWMKRQIDERVNVAGVSVWLLRYRHRGWNEAVASAPSPVPDARWALDEVRRELGDVPVVLLGHSMGARTAVAVADDPSVAGVVALAPWLPAAEQVTASAELRDMGRAGHYMFRKLNAWNAFATSRSLAIVHQPVDR